MMLRRAHRLRQIPGFLAPLVSSMWRQLGRVDTQNVQYAYILKGWWCPSPLGLASKHITLVATTIFYDLLVLRFQTCTMAMNRIALTGVTTSVPISTFFLDTRTEVMMNLGDVLRTFGLQWCRIFVS